MVKTARRKKTSKTKGTRKNIPQKPLSESILILKTTLKTNQSLRTLFLNALNDKNVAPSWKGINLDDVVKFFAAWETALVSDDTFFNSMNEFTVLTQTYNGNKLLQNEAFLGWLWLFFEGRRRFLSSPASIKNLSQILTQTPGFDMQVMPATREGTPGPLNGTPYQKEMIKKNNLLKKLIIKNGTPTLDISKKKFLELYNFKSFSDFFLRRYLPGTRPIGQKPSWWNKDIPYKKNMVICAPADGTTKLLFKSTKLDTNFLIKQETISLKENFKVCNLSFPTKCTHNKYLHKFQGGPMSDTLLMHTNYHHYHAPVSGKVIVVEEFGGLKLEHIGPSGIPKIDKKWEHQRNMSATRTNMEYSWYRDTMKHRRAVYIFDTNVKGGSRVGLVMMIPIGFYDVGSMKTNITEGQIVKMGQEVGNFEFGGSSIIVVYEPNKVDMAIPDIVAKQPEWIGTSKFMPVKVRQAVGVKK